MKKRIVFFTFFAIWCIALSDSCIVLAHDTYAFDYKYRSMNDHINIIGECSTCNYYDLSYYHSNDNNLTFAFNPQNYFIDENNNGIPDFSSNIIIIFEDMVREAASNWNSAKFIGYNLCNLEEITDYDSAEIKIDFTASENFDYAGQCQRYIDNSLPLDQRMHTNNYRVTYNLLGYYVSTFAHELGHALGLSDLDESDNIHHSNTLMGYNRDKENYIFPNAPTIYELQGISLIKDIIYQENARFYEPHPSYYGAYNKIYFTRNNTLQTSNISGMVEKSNPNTCTHDYRCLGFCDDTYHYEACWNCYSIKKTKIDDFQNSIVGYNHYKSCLVCDYHDYCDCELSISYDSSKHLYSYSCGYSALLNQVILYNIIPNNNTYHRAYCQCGYSYMQAHKLLPYGTNKLKCNKCNYICNQVFE